jgi:hypothetical protein
MNAGNKVFARSKKARFASMALCLLPIGIGIRQLYGQRTTAVTNEEKIDTDDANQVLLQHESSES